MVAPRTRLRRLFLPDGRTIPLAPAYGRPIPCGACRGDLGASTIVYLTPEGQRLCSVCFAGRLQHAEGEAA